MPSTMMMCDSERTPEAEDREHRDDRREGQAAVHDDEVERRVEAAWRYADSIPRLLPMVMPMRGGDQADGERDARAPDEPAEDVLCDLVGPEPVRPGLPAFTRLWRKSYVVSGSWSGRKLREDRAAGHDREPADADQKKTPERLALGRVAGRSIARRPGLTASTSPVASGSPRGRQVLSTGDPRVENVQDHVDEEVHDDDRDPGDERDALDSR